MTQRYSRRAFLRAASFGAGGVVANELLAACAGASAPAAPALTAAPPPTATPAPTAEPEAKVRFPRGFLWGAATSAYQIEGAAREDGRGESVWDRFSHTPGKVLNGDTGDVANDHYHLYEQDLDLMKELGFQTYRFSISWPRVIPGGKGSVNQRGLDFYKRLVDGLLARDIRPMATLFHWDTPQELQDQGGWEKRDTAERFAEYADATFRALGDRVPMWLTLNEPKTVVQVGYTFGTHAPGFQDASRGYLALHHMLLGHGLSVQAFRAAVPNQKIGLALNLSPIYPADTTQGAKDAAKLEDGYENRLYLDPPLRGAYPADVVESIGGAWHPEAIKDGDMQLIGAPIELLGVNYYNPRLVGVGRQIVPGPYPYSAAFWQQIYPEGLYDLLVRLKRDYGDIALSITENGAPFEDTLTPDGQVNDPKRLKVLHDHFLAAQRAIAEGVNLESFHVWSFMDNFEWAEGYSQRWGIVYVDFKTQRRYPKRSALWYRDVIRRNGVNDLPEDIR